MNHEEKKSESMDTDDIIINEELCNIQPNEISSVKKPNPSLNVVVRIKSKV
jgi:hypothetical protein